MKNRRKGTIMGPGRGQAGRFYKPKGRFSRKSYRARARSRRRARYR